MTAARWHGPACVEAASGAGPQARRSVWLRVGRDGPRSLGISAVRARAAGATRRAFASDLGARVLTCSFLPAGGLIDNGSHASCVRPLSRTASTNPNDSKRQFSNRMTTAALTLNSRPQRSAGAIESRFSASVSCRVFLSRKHCGIEWPSVC